MDEPAMTMPLSLAPEMFARHAAALRALARVLLRNPADADDVVQETWIDCLESPPARRASIGNWLNTVLRRRASNHRRAAARRERHEGDARKPESFDPRELQERERTLQSVVAALGALDEPLKQVVMLRYFEGLPPRDVADRLKLEPKVVYDRLHRAHTKLRSRLEREFGSARALTLALGALSGEQATEWAAFATVARASSKVSWTHSPVAITAAVVFSLGVIFVALREWSRGSEPTRDGKSGAVAVASFDAASRSAPSFDGQNTSTTTADTGRDEVEPTPGGEVRRKLPLPTHECDLELTVLDPLDRTQAFQTIYAAPAGGTLNVVGVTDPNGRFALRTRVWCNVAELDVALSVEGVARRIEVRPGVQTLVLRTPLAPRAGLDGIPLVGMMASPNTDASFFEALEEEFRSSPHASNDATRRLTFFEPGLISGAGELASDEDAPTNETAGDFEFEAVSEYVPSASPNDASHPDQTAPMPGNLAGSVIDADGLPRRGVVVSVRRFDDGTWDSQVTDERGEYAFERLGAGAFIVQANGGEFGTAVERVAIESGRRTHLETQLQLGEVLEGTLVDATGRALRDWSIEVEGADGLAVLRTDATGRFKSANVPRGELRLLASPLTNSPVPPLGLADAVHASGGARTYVVDVDAEAPMGELRIVPLNPMHDTRLNAASGSSGTHREFDVRVWRVDSGRGAAASWANDANVASARVLPGEYRVEVLFEGREPREFGSVFVAAGEVRELTLDTTPGARAAFSGPARNESTHVVLLRRGECFDALVSLPSSNVRELGLRPGVYSAWDALEGRWLADFEVAADAEADVILAGEVERR